MTEYNYFCWSKKFNDKDSFQQARYRVFNVQLTKEEYEKIPKINSKLEFDRNESYATRYQTAFRKMWEGLTKEEQKEYLDIPHFNWEGFTFITGIKKEDVESKKKIILDGKEIEISEESFEAFKKQFTN